MTQFKSLFFGSAMALAGFVSAAPAADKTIVETAVEAGSFQTLVKGVQAAGLAETLSGEGPFTVFAPTDEAFDALPEGTLQGLLADDARDQLTSVLTYHVVPGKVLAEKVVGLEGAETVNGQRLEISADQDRVQVDGANVIKTDIECSNGVIHVIDAVLLPASQTIPEIAEADGRFSTLLAAAEAAGLVETLSGDGPLTVFAPTDEAFSTLPVGTIETLLQPENRQQLADILKYHVTAGRKYSSDVASADSVATVLGPTLDVQPAESGVLINGARLLATDIDAANGVIHVIDRVLTPPESADRSSAAATSSTVREMIVEAIDRGVPIYNAGHHGQCAEIYTEALRKVAAMPDPALSKSMRTSVRQTLQRASHTHGMSSRAWILRRQMDAILMSQ